jgi:hypothetical protein
MMIRTSAIAACLLVLDVAVAAVADHKTVCHEGVFGEERATP